MRERFFALALLHVAVVLLIVAVSCTGDFLPQGERGSGGSDGISEGAEDDGAGAGEGGGDGEGSGEPADEPTKGDEVTCVDGEVVLPDPMPLFNQGVASLLRGACTTCHEGQAPVGPQLFGDIGEADDYAAVVANTTLNGAFRPGAATLLTKGPHQGAQWWTPEQSAAIGNWLDAEYLAANPPPPETCESGDPTGGNGSGGEGEPLVPEIPTPDELLAEWVGCMTLDNWDNAEMGDWSRAQVEDAEDLPCRSCHNEGEFGFYTNRNNDVMYEQQRTYLGVQTFFTIEIDAEGNPDVVPALTKIDAKCEAQNLHPPCENIGGYYERLQDFYQLTLEARAAGNCAAPGFAEP